MFPMLRTVTCICWPGSEPKTMKLTGTGSSGFRKESERATKPLAASCMLIDGKPVEMAMCPEGKGWACEGLTTPSSVNSKTAMHGTH